MLALLLGNPAHESLPLFDSLGLFFFFGFRRWAAAGFDSASGSLSVVLSVRNGLSAVEEPA